MSLEWKQSNCLQHTEISLLETYNTVHKHNFICVSATYFDSLVESDDDDLRINGYELIPTDHPLNTKRGDVCINYKESLAVKMINISYFQECLFCKVIIKNIRGYIAFIYRSPSQSSSDFQHFLSGFEQLLINIKGFKPDFTVLLDDYNACSKSWWAFGTNTPEHMQLDALT